MKAPARLQGRVNIENVSRRCASRSGPLSVPCLFECMKDAADAVLPSRIKVGDIAEKKRLPAGLSRCLPALEALKIETVCCPSEGVSVRSVASS